MTSPRIDPLSSLLELVRAAAREGAEQALAAQRPTTPPTSGSLVDKRGLAHALGVSPATIDRLCRDGRIPFTRVGDVRRFDPVAVLAALEQGVEASATSAGSASRQVRVAGVRLLSRAAR
jgi:excisionase family DNA binding protein